LESTNSSPCPAPSQCASKTSAPLRCPDTGPNSLVRHPSQTSTTEYCAASTTPNLYTNPAKPDANAATLDPDHCPYSHRPPDPAQSSPAAHTQMPRPDNCHPSTPSPAAPRIDTSRSAPRSEYATDPRRVPTGHWHSSPAPYRPPRSDCSTRPGTS